MTEPDRRERYGTALAEAIGGARRPTAPVALTISCSRCTARSPRVLGKVFATSVGLLLVIGHKRRQRLTRPDAEHDWTPEPGRRTTAQTAHLLGEPIDAAQWFGTCDRHGQRTLPPEQVVVVAARDTRRQSISV